MNIYKADNWRVAGPMLAMAILLAVATSGCPSAKAQGKAATNTVQMDCPGCGYWPDPAQRIAKLEARVSTLEAALVEMRGNIKEYHFSTAAGAFVCGRCKIEEDKEK